MITEANQLCNPDMDPPYIWVYDYTLDVMTKWDWEKFMQFLSDQIYDKAFSLDKKIIENEAGDFIFIEPGIPHEVFNMSDTEEVQAIVVRSDPNEWENIINYDRNSEG